MNKKFYLNLSLFLIINLLLYCFIILFNAKVPFNSYNYYANAHHYLPDQRVTKNSFNLLNALGQYDAQWYLKIAQKGYPKNPVTETMANKNLMGGLSYAFFPLYPLTLSIVNLSIHNIELSAFALTNLLLILNFFSLYFVLKKFYTSSIAFKTIFLLFLFPFSLFYRSYFSESLFLFFLVWFSYGLLSNKWFLTSVMLSALMITRGTGLFLLPLFLFYLWQGFKRKQIHINKLAAYLILSLIPFLLWCIYCYWQTGNFLYFASIQSAWNNNQISIIHNLILVFNFPLLPMHSFHYSQLDILTIIVTLSLLIFSWKKINTKLWLISFLLWLGPLLTTDTMSFTRFQTISFPLFLYGALTLKNKSYKLTVIVFCILFFILSLFFVNWYWLG